MFSCKFSMFFFLNIRFPVPNLMIMTQVSNNLSYHLLLFSGIIVMAGVIISF